MLELPIITHEHIMIGKGDIYNIDASVAEGLLEKIKADPDYCLREGETGRSISNRELLRQVVALAEALRSRGLKAGDVISISSENRLEYAIPIVASLALGTTISTLNPLYTIDELKHVLSISKPRILFCSPFTAGRMKEIQKVLPFIEEIIFFDSGTPCEGFTRFTELVNRPVDVSSFRYSPVNPRQSVAAILCSSGTTGLPKCVELTHSNVLCFMNVVKDNIVRQTQADSTESVILGLVPFFHGYGFCVILTSLAMSTKLVILSRFEEHSFLSTIQNYKINSLHIVPPLVVFLAKNPLVDKYDLSSVKEILSGAAPLSREVQAAARKRLKLPSEIRQAYGMTELSISATLTPSNGTKLGSVGVVVAGMECKVVDIDTGKALPPFKEGELCFKGPFLMKGYRNDPEATAKVIDSDGWLHTGDVGYYDEEGYLFIVDRLKELIKFKGFQVAPAELEALLLTNPKIKDAAVIGIPNEMAGELPMAFIVKQLGVNLTEDEVKKFIAGKVSPQKRLHVVKFVEEIPKNPSGKILRRKLREYVKKSKL